MQKMSVYICSMSDGCNLEKKCIGDGYSSSVFTPTLLLTGSSKENEFPWELFWALFFFLHALKNRVEQHDVTPKTVKCFCVGRSGH